MLSRMKEPLSLFHATFGFIAHGFCFWLVQCTLDPAQILLIILLILLFATSDLQLKCSSLFVASNIFKCPSTLDFIETVCCEELSSNQPLCNASMFNCPVLSVKC